MPYIFSDLIIHNHLTLDKVPNKWRKATEKLLDEAQAKTKTEPKTIIEDEE